MELVWAVTIWGLWACWLLCQHLGARRAFTRAAAVLLVAELLALALRWYDCDAGGCGVAAGVGASLATIDVPALAALLVATATADAWRRAAERSRGGRPPRQPR